MNHLLSLYDREVRVDIQYPGVRKDATSNAVRFIRPAPGGNFISFNQFDVDSADTFIAEQLAFFAPYHDQKLTWEVYSHDPQCEVLREKLPAYGFELDDEAAVMLLDISTAPKSLLAPPQHNIRRITHPDGLADVISVLEKVWGGNFGWIHDRLGKHLEIPGYLSVYVAYIGNQPACAAWTYFHTPRFASLYAGSTLPEFRKLGLYTDILATRTSEIKNRGCQYALIDAGEMSRPIVEKHGFQYLATLWDYELRATAE
jgi:hypothetical protein